MNSITLTKVYNPLNRSDQDRISYEYVPGQTLAQLLDSCQAVKLAERESLKLAVSVNGQLIVENDYHATRLMPGQQIVIIPVLSGGGGSGDGKDAIRMVGMIIIAIVATVVSYGTLTSTAIAGMIGGTAATATTAASMGMVALSALAGAAVMVAGSMLLNAVLPPTRPAIPSLNGYSSIDQSNSYSWSPKNTQQQGVAIPWHYGICKLTGNIIGVWRESIGREQYLNILIGMGEGPLANLYDLKLNGQPLENYRGITPYTRLGYLDQPYCPNFGDTRVEYPLATRVSFGSPVQYTTIGQNFDCLEIAVGFPNGLYRYDNTGGLKDFSVNYSVEIKRQGDSEWTLLTRTPYQRKVSEGGYWSLGSWGIVDNQIGTTGYIEYQHGDSDPESHYIGEPGANGCTWQWFGSPFYLIDAIHDYSVASAAIIGPVNYSFKAWDLIPGKYDIRVIRLTADETDSRFGDDFYLMAVQEIVLDDFTYPGQAIVGLRALATDQLSGSFSFECKTAGRLCRVYANNAWSVVATSNPAWICFDILTQPVYDNDLNVLEYRAHPAGNLDVTKWVEWAAYCDDLVSDGNGGTEKRLTYNGSFDSAQTMWDAALSVAKIGRATCYWRGTEITVAVDKPSEPVALISIGNIGLDSFEETFLNMESRAGSIDADFINFDKGLERDKFTVINPDAPGTWGAASLPLAGVIKPSEVWRHCRYYLACTAALTRVISIQMDVDSIAFTLGDIILVQHDVPMWGEGGRIVSAASDLVLLDREFSVVAGKSYSIMVRLLNGTMIERTVANLPGTTASISISTPFETIPAAFDIYAIGEVDRSIKPMRVVGIDPAGDLKRKITLTDYNESIYVSDMLEPVLTTTNYSAAVLPNITGLQLSESLVKDNAGAITSMINVRWDALSNPLVRYIEVLFNGVTQIRLNENASSYVAAVADGLTYQVHVRPVGWLGNAQPLNYATSASINILGKIAPPSNVQNLRGAATSFGGLILTWDAVTDIDLDHYAVRYCGAVGGNWENAIDIGSAYTTTLTLPAALDGTYLVKAVDTSAIESLAAAAVITGIPSLINYNFIETVDDGADWSGTKTGCFSQGGRLYLDMAGLIDDVTDFNALTNIDTYGGAVPEGYYTISSTVDLGMIQTSRCAASVEYSAVDTSLYFDSFQDFDAIRFFDGDAVPGVMVQPQIRISDDGATWGEWQPFIAGDYTARALQFRLKLSTSISTNIPEVASYSVSIDMPDRTERGQGVSVAAGGTAITFTKAYMVPPIIRTTIQGATSGDTEKITSITTTGFTVQILNGGSGVARTVDWQSVGY